MGKPFEAFLRSVFAVSSLINDFLCLALLISTAGITALSAFRVIENTAAQAEWRTIFYLVGLVGALAILIGGIQYIILSHNAKRSLLTLKHPALVSIFERKRKITPGVATFLRMTIIFNSADSYLIWEGGGHGLAGTWKFTAGSAPIVLSFIAMLAIAMQAKILKKMART